MPDYVTHLTLSKSSAILEIEGELDLSNTKQLITVIQESVNTFKSIFVDLTKVTYINSSSIGALISFQQRKKDSIKLIVPKESAVYPVLEALDLNKFFQVYENRELATRYD